MEFTNDVDKLKPITPFGTTDQQPTEDQLAALKEQDRQRKDNLLRNTLVNTPGVDPGKIPELMVALRASGVEVSDDGLIPFLGSALRALEVRQPALFRPRAAGTTATRREELERLFGPRSNGREANELAIRDKQVYRELRTQARALGIC